MLNDFENVHEKLMNFAKMLSQDGVVNRGELFKLLNEFLDQMGKLREEYTKLLEEHLEELSKTYQEISTLFELNNLFANVVDPSEVFEPLTQTLRQTIPFKSIFIELNVLGKNLVYEKNQLETDLISIAKKILQNFEGVVLIEPEHGMKLKNLLSIPIGSGETKWGRITLIEKEHGIFTAADRKILEAVAFQLAASCERYTRLWREIERQRMREQLEIARQIQLSLLPKRLPQLDHFQIAARTVPAIQVGGDYYDLILVRGNLLVAVADVSGKGIPAALLMTSLRSTLRTLVKSELDLSHLAKELNNTLCDDLEEDRFVTIALMCFHADGTVRLINAGHNPIIRVHANGSTLMEAQALPMGIVKELDYEESQFRMHPGEALVIYTDGVTEARNEHGEEFGLQRFVEVLQSCANESAQTMVKNAEDELKRFCGEATQHDDSTLVVVKYLGKTEN
ncbi:PP2C family protein-serine/threonine phosphatase [Pseudothermotoga sp.]|uniref:PP2C family protein-serine/threonine phosphatase n=1 Tax=Pseudothermotoga sp. TaxID=2033661 RepID=UPI0031F68403